MPNAPLRILQLSDPHLHTDPRGNLRGVRTNDTFRQVVAHLRASGQKPDLILATGDLVQDDSRGGYEVFREVMGDFDVPVHCLAGNHDVPGLLREVLAGPPFRLEGLVVQPPWCLLLLDTWVPDDAGGRLSAAEIRRLDATLTAHRSHHALLVLHHHPLAMGSRWLDTVGLRNADEFLAVVDRHPQVRGVLWGHVHQASDRERHGVRFISTPSTCAQFLPGSEDFALDTRPPAYRWLDLYPDGTIGTQVVWME